MPTALDLTGQRFGYLVACKMYRQSDHYGKYWICKCDCGNEVAIRASHLKSGHSTSCGCKRLRKEG